jgi:hypothetical protein
VNLSPRARARLGWALAPVLASLAVLLQWIVDVPKGTILEREPPTLVGDLEGDSSDTGSEPKSSKPRGERVRKSKSKGKGKPKKPTVTPRTPEQRAQLRENWSARPIQDEPVDQQFRRAHEALLRSVATRARTAVLGKREPVPMQIRPSCRSIRCSLELCGDETVLDDVAELLPKANVAGASLWHELREVEPSRQPAAHEVSKIRCRRWIVDFAREDVAVGQVRFDEPTPPEPT